MKRQASLLFVVMFLVQLGSPVGGVAAPAGLDVEPGELGQQVRSCLFSVQEALAAGDQAGAASAFAPCPQRVSRLSAAFSADPRLAAEIQASLASATDGIAGNDEAVFAFAKGRIWTMLLRGAYAEAIAAVTANRPDDAASWLMLREFRPTTKFARPNADATLAVRSIRAGEMSPDDAVATIQADLLDTYQSQLSAELAVLQDSTTADYSVLRFEAGGLASGYWSILADSYERQMGADKRAEADQAVQQMETAVRQSDPDAVASAVTSVSTIAKSFRAAPLSEEEQSRRAGQLLRYLSLVPVEYGRGVSGGEVILDIEIQEAQVFLDASRASFDDLYLTLLRQDPAKTAEVDRMLSELDRQIKAAAARTSVADHDLIRTQSSQISDTLTSMFPETWIRDGGTADFDVIGSVLDQMEAAIIAGKPDQAESARLEAYAIYDVGAEKRLLAFAPDLARRTEQLFWGGTDDTPGLATAIQNGASVEEIRSIRSSLDQALTDGQQRLGAGRPAAGVVIFNAATIVFREGLEAVLILASLVASMIGANRRFKRPLVLGALLAFLATALLFWLAQTVLQWLSRYGEKLEAIVSLVAIGVLLLVMNWFFHKVYWTKWISKHHTRRRTVIGSAAGQALGLIVLGFTSVFREGAETVLFLQALVLDAGVLVVIEGTLVGLAGTAIVGALVLVLQTKLPHKKMLMVTGVMIAMVLVVMVGTTTHVLQVVGWLPISPIQGVVVPYWMGVWFGLYGTWQGILLQVLALVFVIGSYYAAEYTQERRRNRPITGLTTASS